MKILFVTGGFGGGGAEKVVLQLSNELANRGHKILCLSFRSNKDYTLNKHDNLSFKSLGVSRAIFGIKKYITQVSEFKPDIIISNLTYINIISCISLILTNANYRLILVEHNVQFVDKFGFVQKKPVLRFLAKKIFKYSSCLVGVSSGVINDSIKYFNVPIEKTFVIYNPVISKDIFIKANESLPDTYLNKNKYKPFLFVGAQTFQKGVDLLLRAYKEYLSQSKIKRNLYIIGKGTLKELNEKYVKNNDLTKFVTFIGFDENPYKYMQAAQALIVPSRWEGFCNVVAEGLALGVNVITSNCHSGPAEIVSAYGRGDLFEVGDVHSLASIMISKDEFMYEPEINKSLFTVAESADKYESLFNKILNK